MKLTHLEFVTLPAEEQGGYVFSQGTYLASRQEGNYSVNLYHLDTFYCELWMEQHCPELDFFRTFRNQRCLAPYLQELTLPVKYNVIIRQPNAEE
ncbi:MAG: hypothetical protein H7Z21_19485 [Hymenobacter sp.]|nr:hypothetical protein [Hymenobacter sp.]